VSLQNYRCIYRTISVSAELSVRLQNYQRDCRTISLTVQSSEGRAGVQHQLYPIRLLRNSEESRCQVVVGEDGLHGWCRCGFGLVWNMVHISPGPNIMITTNMISSSLYSIFDGSCGIVLE